MNAIKSLVFMLAFIHVNLIAEEATISVTGQSEVVITPNAYSVTVMVEEQGNVVEKLAQVVDQKTEQIVSFLLSQNIPESNIQSMHVSLRPHYKNTPAGPQPAGVILIRKINIVSESIGNYARVLDGLYKRGIDRMDNFQFFHTKEGMLREQAAVDAVINAREKANKMISPLDMRIIGVKSVDDMSVVLPIVQEHAGVMRSQVAIQPGTLSVPASVNVVFLLSTQQSVAQD